MLRKLFGLGRADRQESEGNRYGIDTDCNYCPQCEEAYRAEIETCASCSVSLIPGSEKLDLLKRQDSDLSRRSLDISADDELVAIHSGKLMSLKQLQQVLKKAYIPSLLAGGGDEAKG